MTCDDVEQDARDGHRSRHGDAIGGREGARRLETKDEKEAADHESRVDGGDVNLPRLGARGVNDCDTRAVMQLHRLLGQRERAGDQGLRGDHGGEGGDCDERIEKVARRQEIERVVDRVRNTQHERALSEVVEQQRGEHQPEPHQADRASAEVPHVSVQSLGPRHGEHDRAQHEEAGETVLEEERHAVPGIQREQDGGVPDDLAGAEHPDQHEPHEHDRPEHGADRCRPVPLEEEQQKQGQQRGGNDVARELRSGDRQALDGTEHGDGRRDDAVAIEQRRAKESERDEDTSTSPLQQQREEGEDAALAVIIQTHDEHDVLDADDQDQRPDDR